MGFANIKPVGSAPGLDAGEFMSGGIFSKAIDALSVGGYMSAGAADALLRGENPLAGAVEGIRTRRSYVDVMSERGVPSAIATPLGIVSDIALDPSTWLVGGANVAARAGRIAQLKAVAKSLPEGVRTAEDVARGVGDLAAWDQMAAQAQLFRLGRQQVARKAYAEAEGGLIGKFREARRAAKDYNPTAEELAKLGPEVLASSRFGPLSPSQAGGWSKALDYLKTRLVYSMEDYVTRAAAEFGNIGPDFVRHAKKQEAVAQGLQAETAWHAKKIVKLVGKDQDDQIKFWKAVHGLEPEAELNPRLFHAVQKWRELAEVRFRDLQKAGVKQVHTALSIAFARKTPEVQQKILHLLQQGLADPNQVFEAGSAEWFAKKIQEVGGQVTKEGAVHVPIQHREFYGPLYHKGQALRGGRPSQMEFQDIVNQLMEAEPGLGLEEARRVAEGQAMEIFMAPNDVRKQFQFGRLADNVPVNPKLVEMNPAIWMSKWSRDVSDRIAQAMVWGGDDEAFKAMKESLELQADRVPGFKGHERLQHIFDLVTGQARHPMRPAVAAVSQAANIFFLGPRTAILQATQQANNAAWSGIGNAIVGVVKALEDPALRELTERLGVAMPSIYHAADADALSKMTLAWHKIMGIDPADRFMRISGAIGSGINGLETAENFMRAVRAKNAAATARFANVLQMHGVDPQAVLQRNGRLVAEEVQAFMLRGANATNFTNSVMSLPSVFREPGGQFFLKFKTYAAQQSGFINRLIQRAKNGDWEPFITYIAMFPWVYGMTFRAMNALRSKPIDTEDDWAMLQNMALTGAFGFWGDAAMALGSPSEAMRLGIVAGPNVSMLTKATGGVAEIARGEADLSDPMQLTAATRQLKTLVTGEYE